jgi:hypothetical protein
VGEETELDRSGVMLVRVWLHDGELVARLQSSSGGREQHAQVAVGLDPIAESVRVWLRDLAETPP